MRALDEVDEAELVERYGRGQTVEQLAERFGVAVTTVRRILDRAGVDRRPRGFQQTYPAGATATIVRMRGDGASWAEIAAAVGMHPSGVRRRYGRALAGREGRSRPGE